MPQSIACLAQCIDFESSGTNQTLYLQVLREPMPVLDCLCGDWQSPSRAHARLQRDWAHYKEPNPATTIPYMPSEADVDTDYEQNDCVCHSEK